MTFGPTAVEQVNKYRYSSNKPKLMLQFSSADISKKIYSQWTSTLFHGSTCRLTTDPKTLSENCAMLCGVPHEAITANILSDIHQSYKVPQCLSGKNIQERSFYICSKQESNLWVVMLGSVNAGVALLSVR